MAENTPPGRDESEEAPAPQVPSHGALPPPPDVHFTRPTLGKSDKANQHIASTSGQIEGRNSNLEPPNLLSQGAQGYGLAITAALTLAITLLAFIALGQWLDHRFNHSAVPWFTIVGLLIGIAGGFFNMIRLLTTSGRRK